VGGKRQFFLKFSLYFLEPMRVSLVRFITVTRKISLLANKIFILRWNCPCTFCIQISNLVLNLCFTCVIISTDAKKKQRERLCRSNKCKIKSQYLSPTGRGVPLYKPLKVAKSQFTLCDIVNASVIQAFRSVYLLLVLFSFCRITNWVDWDDCVVYLIKIMTKKSKLKMECHEI